MRKYEAAIILKPHFDDETAKTEIEKIQTLFTRFGATIEKVDEWGRRRLAYEIQKIREGIYYFITFTAEPGAPAEIESRLRIAEEVLRYLIISLDEN